VTKYFYHIHTNTSTNIHTIIPGVFQTCSPLLDESVLRFFQFVTYEKNQTNKNTYAGKHYKIVCN